MDSGDGVGGNSVLDSIAAHRLVLDPPATVLLCYVKIDVKRGRHFVLLFAVTPTPNTWPVIFSSDLPPM